MIKVGRATRIAGLVATAAATLGLCIHGIQVLLPFASGVLVDTLVLFSCLLAVLVSAAAGVAIAQPGGAELAGEDAALPASWAVGLLARSQGISTTYAFATRNQDGCQ